MAETMQADERPEEALSPGERKLAASRAALAELLGGDKGEADSFPRSNTMRTEGWPPAETVASAIPFASSIPAATAAFIHDPNISRGSSPILPSSKTPDK